MPRTRFTMPDSCTRLVNLLMRFRLFSLPVFSTATFVDISKHFITHACSKQERVETDRKSYRILYQYLILIRYSIISAFLNMSLANSNGLFLARALSYYVQQRTLP